MAAPPNTLVLIDGHSLLHRAFFALPALATRTGVPTNAVYGFVLMLNRLLSDHQPDSIVVAFDKSAPTFRHEAYDKYKAHRPRMPDELRSQLPLVKEVLAAHRIPIFEHPGYEADDVIGTLAELASRKGMTVLIVTGDKDALQLVDESVHVALIRKGIREVELYDVEKVQEIYGIPARRIVDLKGLMGDASDNIPGVPGIGEKTALKLLREYGSVEELLQRKEEVKGKVGKALRQYENQALLSTQLATIDTNVPIDVDWSLIRRVEPDYDRLGQLYEELEFRSLREAIPGTKSASVKSVASDLRQESDVSVDVIVDPKALQGAVAVLKKEPSIAVMAVWDGGTPIRASVAGVALATDRRVIYLPIAHSRGDNLPIQALQASLRELLVNDVPKVCHDAKSQALALDTLGLSLNHVVDDTMIAAYLLAPGQGEHSLEEIAQDHLGVRLPPLTEKGDGGKRKRKVSVDLADFAPKELARRIQGRITSLVAVAPRLRAKLRQDELEDVYSEIELPLTSVLVDMERRGVRVDIGELQLMSKEMGDELARLEARVFELAGEEFNIRSPAQLGRILFDKLGLPVISKGKSGPSTSAEVLEALAEEHEIAGVVLEYRQLHKLKSGYVDALPSLVNATTGRIHTTFRQDVAATGRLSSANPNLQNIPVRTAAGRKIRKAFVAPEGWLMLKADYSQIELRVLAHISRDPDLIEAFRRGEDIHKMTAAEVYGVPPDEVSGEQRDAAKAINFGIVYGISSFGLARGTGLTRSRAKELIDGYFQRYPAVRRYMEETVARAKEVGYVTTLCGRRRYLPDLTSRRRHVRAFAERTAINTPIQGSAADIIKKAMLAVHRRIASEGLMGRLVLQVHDELLFEVPPDQLEPLARLVKEEMEGVVELDVPLKVELQQGSNWLEGREVDLDA